MAVEYASEYGFAEVESMAKIIPKAMPLSELQKSKLDDLVSGSLTRAKDNLRSRKLVSGRELLSSDIKF